MNPDDRLDTPRYPWWNIPARDLLFHEVPENDAGVIEWVENRVYFSLRCGAFAAPGMRPT